MRFGLLGCGTHGARYLRHLQRDVDEASATAIYRRDRGAADHIAAEYGIRSCASAEELFTAPDVDAILIVTPPAGHLRELEMALQTGKHVLIEKPVVARWDEAKGLAELNPPTVMVAQTLRFSPILQRARELASGLGTLHRIRVAQRLQPSELAWQRDSSLAGSGSVTLTGVHLFDLLRWIVGRSPDRVQCAALHLAGHSVENLFDACFLYDNEQILAATEVSKFSGSRSAVLELVGDDAQLVVDYMNGRMWKIQGRDWTLLEEVGDVPTLIGTLREFVRFARGEIENPVPVRDGCEALRMADACYRAQAERSVVQVYEEEP